MSKAADWINRGEDVITRTYGRYPIVPTRGEGCRLWDADGREYLDFLAGIAVNNLGHCHPAVVKALQHQASKLLHCSNYYHIPQQIELAELLTDNSFGDRAFFCNSGVEANEAALKLARKRSFEQHGTDRFEVITALASFHGRTFGGISATGQDKVRSGFEPVVPGFKHVPFGDTEALQQAITPQTCAILLEPVQGEGGVNVPPDGYLAAARRICDQHDLLLIFDEVQVGCGRTGHLFAYQHDGVEPDIMTLAKALGGGPPIGAMIAREEVAASFGPGSHGSTFGGNPLVAAAGVATMKVLLEGDVLANCLAMGAYFRQQLEALHQHFPFVHQVRGRGLMLGMELGIEGADIVIKAMERGLLLNCTVGKVLRFVPPLTVTRAEIDQGMEILTGILQEI